MDAGAKAFLESVSNACEPFIDEYYKTLDQPERLKVAEMYHPSAAVTFNGNPITTPNLKSFLSTLPLSRYSLESVNCHPLGQTSAAYGPLKVVVAVSGQVRHVRQADELAAESNEPNLLPRVFSQTFLLSLDLNQVASAQPRCMILADTFRFV